MTTLIIFLPAVAAVLIVGVRKLTARATRILWLGIAVAELALLVGVSLYYRVPAVGRLAFEQQVTWIPNVGSSYHVGIDGLSLPLLLLTAVTFVAAALWCLKQTDRPRSHAALFLALESTCLGLFAAQDLILFFLFFDLSIVGMYFVIAGWGHGDAKRSALKFFLYTFLGSLALLVGFIGLYLGAAPHTFDMVALARAGAFRSGPIAGGFVLAAIVVGLAIKTPTFPFHSWLPPAHTDAPTVGSVVLASVLLKMGTYGFIRIAMPMLPDSWRSWAWVIVAVGIVSVLYGSLVAMAQSNLKRMIAYTSVNHMGYILLAVGAAGLVSTSTTQAAQIALVGAVVQMVSHGLITGALFLLSGVLYSRRQDYDLSAYGGLAGPAPRFAGFFAVAAFASLGLPGFSGFIAEFQIFTGSVGLTWVAAVALPGILITAALLLRAFQRLFTGPTAGKAIGFGDLTLTESLPTGLLLALAIVIGIFPAPLLALIQPATAAVVGVVAG